MLSAMQFHKTTHIAKGCNYQATWAVMMSSSTDFVVKCAEQRIICTDRAASSPKRQYKTELTVCLTELSHFDVDVAGQNVCEFFHCCQGILAELEPQDDIATSRDNMATSRDNIATSRMT